MMAVILSVRLASSKIFIINFIILWQIVNLSFIFDIFNVDDQQFQEPEIVSPKEQVMVRLNN